MWRLPKTDWKADDYFNYSDYTRIIENISEVKTKADKVFVNVPAMLNMESKTAYTAIPYADNWNAIDTNVRTLDRSIFNESLYASTFVENGYTPNYEVFNKWESVSARMYTHVLSQYASMENLEITLGGATQFGMRKHYIEEEEVARRLWYDFGTLEGDIQ